VEADRQVRRVAHIDGVRRRRRRPTEVPIEDRPHLRSRELGPATVVQGGEIDARIQAALSELSPAQRTVFVLRHYEGHTLAEIAPIMGCTIGSVKVHLFRALKKMRAALDDLREEQLGRESDD
jgi:RNA polymerase sigma-70 factor (ECF subfamily)